MIPTVIKNKRDEVDNKSGQVGRVQRFGFEAAVSVGQLNTIVNEAKTILMGCTNQNCLERPNGKRVVGWMSPQEVKDTRKPLKQRGYDIETTPRKHGIKDTKTFDVMCRKVQCIIHNLMNHVKTKYFATMEFDPSCRDVLSSWKKSIVDNKKLTTDFVKAATHIANSLEQAAARIQANRIAPEDQKFFATYSEWIVMRKEDKELIERWWISNSNVVERSDIHEEDTVLLKAYAKWKKKHGCPDRYGCVANPTLRALFEVKRQNKYIDAWKTKTMDHFEKHGNWNPTLLDVLKWQQDIYYHVAQRKLITNLVHGSYGHINQHNKEIVRELMDHVKTEYLHRGNYIPSYEAVRATWLKSFGECLKRSTLFKELEVVNEGAHGLTFADIFWLWLRDQDFPDDNDDDEYDNIDSNDSSGQDNLDNSTISDEVSGNMEPAVETNTFDSSSSGVMAESGQPPMKKETQGKDSNGQNRQANSARSELSNNGQSNDLLEELRAWQQSRKSALDGSRQDNLDNSTISDEVSDNTKAGSNTGRPRNSAVARSDKFQSARKNIGEKLFNENTSSQ